MPPRATRKHLLPKMAKRYITFGSVRFSKLVLKILTPHAVFVALICYPKGAIDELKSAFLKSKKNARILTLLKPCLAVSIVT